MSFHVIDLDTGQPVGGLGGVVYATGADAASQAAYLTRLHPGKKYQPRPVPVADPNAWRERERDRFRSGAYRATIWEGESWYQAALASGLVADHFCHISQSNREMLAYTETPEKGERDLQTKIRPGAYLQRYFGDVLSGAEIAALVGQHNTAVGIADARADATQLLFADTPQGIDRVYRNGPRSCMCNENDYPHILNRDIFPLHPAHIYAAGDLAVAYYEEHSRIKARCVVWPSKLQAGRIYGNDERMSALLRRAGYHFSQDYDMSGARLLKVRCEYNGSWVMPYIDGPSGVSVRDDGDFFKIGINEDICCSTTSGTNRSRDEGDYEPEEPEGCYCEHCDSYADEDSFTRVRDRDEYWCGDCVERDCMQCEATGEVFYENGYVTLADGTIWSESYWEAHGNSCESCCEAFRADETTYDEETGTAYCESCHADLLAEREEEREEEESETVHPHTTPTIAHRDQLTMPLNTVQDWWRVAIIGINSTFVGYATLPSGTGQGFAQSVMTEAEARALAASLQLGQDYFAYRVERYQFDSSPIESQPRAA